MTERTLKPGWKTVKFEDVVNLNKERVSDPLESGIERYVGLEHITPEDLHIHSWGLVADGTTFTNYFRPGQVLFGKRRAYQRKVAVADFEGVCSGDIYVFEPKDPDILLPELLPFICQSEGFYEHAVGTSAGSLSPRTNWSQLNGYKFPLPPLDEQHIIAEILWSVDDVVKHNQDLVDKMLLLQKSYFVTRNSISDLVQDWPVVTLDDVCIIQNGQIDPRIEPYCQMIHLASDDIESDTGRIIETNTAAQDNITSGNYLFDENAILYSKIRPNLRKVAFPKFSGVCSADVYPLFPKENILPEFLFHLLLSKDFTQYAVSCSTRSAIPKINRKSLLAFRFNLPTKHEQSQIVYRLSSITHALENARTRLSDARKLKSNLLQKILRN